MPLDLNYKNAGAWGPGLGRKLTGVEVDTNFHEVEVAVEALETSRPQPNNITSITTDSTSITFHFQDGTSMGPLPMPILEFRYRGDWAPDTIYQVLDVFIAPGVGEFSVLVDHTSAAVFDQAATDPGGAGPLYLFMLPMGPGESLGDLGDVAITAPTDGQILRYDLATGKWINRDFPPLDELADVVITAAVNNQALVWDTASARWVNRTLMLAALGDVAIAALADGQMLAWHASANAWVNINPPAGTGGGGLSVLLYRGAWSSSGVYAPNDVVRSGAGFYACWFGVGHTSVTPDADGAHWTPLSTIDSNALDGAFGSAPGSIVHRNAIGWAPLLPGAAGTFLKSQGAGQPLVYDTTGLNLAGALDKQYLRYDATAGQWIPTGEGYFHNASGPAIVYAVRGIAPAASGDELGGFVGAGFDGTSVSINAAGYFAEASEAWTAAHHGSRLAFWAIPNGSVTPARLLLLEGDGGLYTPGASGGSRGAGTVNLTGGFFVNGAALSTAGSLGTDLDTIGSTRGSVLFRGASAWQALTPGTNGQVLMSGGPGANPSWGTGGGGSGTLGGLSDVDPTGLADGYSLRYDGSAAKWKTYPTGFFTSLQVQSENQALGTPATLDNYASAQSAVTSFPIFATRQARGTRTAPAAVQAGDLLGESAFYGWDGVGFRLGASVQARATENWTGSAHGAELWFSITNNGTTAPNFVLQITQDGKVKLAGVGTPYGIAFSAPQTTAYAADQVLGHHPLSCAVTIPANFGAAGTRVSQAVGSANATASTVFSVQRCLAAADPTVSGNWSAIGTITFAAGTVAPTFATTGGAAQNLAAGDRVRIKAPTTPDATFAGFYCNIAGFET